MPKALPVLPVGAWFGIAEIDDRHAVIVAIVKRSGRMQMLTRDNPGGAFTKSNNKDIYATAELAELADEFAPVAVFRSDHGHD